MRITNKMMSNNYLRDMNSNLKSLDKINEQMATGKVMSRPSDNPFKVARSMQLTTDINANKQYNDNIKDATNTLDSTDQAVYQATNVLQRVRELMVSSGNAAYGSNESKAIFDEIKERVSELGQVLNTNFDGKYIFGGTKSSSKPVDITTNAVTGSNDITFVDKDGGKLDINSADPSVINQLNNIGADLSVEVSQGVKMNYNVNALDILSFNDSEGNNVNVMELLSQIQTNLITTNESDRSKVCNENLESLDSVISNLLTKRSEIGAKQNRMESALEKNEDESYNMTEILSKTEDIDFTEKSIEYSMAQTTYTAALQVSAKILPATLLDYL
ncbi:flagellar hook-associated protein FlgL [Clostridium vincentii]|uniref:Flagellin n=1 Tax=Clostridium vincentii TaxID=52704 RepID=A0A2T0BG55_9CLOT|nr:flagellar hook-associated protein FlgL [Clostridium vincentii]PRR82834.1 Flagellin [Clostridium vincentii]